MKLIFTVVLFCSLKLIAQNDDNFIIVDTIIFKNPVVFSIDNYDGLHLTEYENLNTKNVKPKNILKSSDVFLFSFNPFLFLNKNQLEIEKLFENYPNYGNCTFSEKIDKKENVFFISFDTVPTKFIVCLISADHYNKIVSTADFSKTILQKTKKNNLYKIVFPLCEARD